MGDVGKGVEARVVGTSGKEQGKKRIELELEPNLSSILRMFYSECVGSQ